MRVNKKFIVFIIIAVIYIGLSFRYLRNMPKRDYCDFKVYYATAERFVNKEDIYNRPDISITPFKYSPLSAMLMSPLSFFPKKVAGLIFFSINFISLIVIFILSKELIVQDKLSTRQRLFLYSIPAICTVRFIAQALYVGQVGIIMFALVLAGLYFLYKEKDILAAACIGLSVMVKYMPFIFIPFLIFRKKIKVAALVLLFILFYCLIPAVYVGVNTHIDYIKSWLPSIIGTSFDTGSWYDFKNQSLFSLVLRYFTVNSPYIKIPPINLTFNQGLVLTFIVGALIYLLIIFPSRKQEFNNPIEYSLLFICMAIFNPNAWMHNFAACVFAYMTICYYLLKINFKDKLTIALAFFAFVLMEGGSEALVGNELENLLEQLSSVTIGALILLFICFRLKYRRF